MWLHRVGTFGVGTACYWWARLAALLGRSANAVCWKEFGWELSFADDLLWAYPMYFLRCVPVTWSALPQTHYAFIAVNVVMWISLLVANKRDPGFLAKNTEEYRR